MGKDYTSEVVIGWIVDLDTMFRRFLVHRDEETELQDRWNPKTGEKVEPERVVTREAGFDIVLPFGTFEGPENDDFTCWHPNDDLIAWLEQELGCDVWLAGNFYDGEVLLCIQPAPLGTQGAPVAIEKLVKHIGEFDRVQRKAEDLGLDIGDARIQSITTVA